MIVQACRMVFVLAIIALLGCSSTTFSETQEDKVTKEPATAEPALGDKQQSTKSSTFNVDQGAKATSSSKTPKATEAEARAALKAALDSWAFGDSLEKFEKDRPDISFFDTRWITKARLGRYDIGTARSDGKSFDFLVTLVLKGDNGDVSRSASYTVIKTPRIWLITGGVN